MAIDDRKQRILTAIVSLYATGGEPVGSHLLSRYFNMAVSSATLRNEMAALTRLGLLEQPHTSAGRVPTTAGYRYYVDHLLDPAARLAPGDREVLDKAFEELDYDPEKLVQEAAKKLSDLLGYAILASTPRAQDMCIAHFEVIQVGRYTAAVLAVTAAGGVRTRVAKVDFELSEKDRAGMAETLNRYLCFVAAADVSGSLVQQMLNHLGAGGSRCWPVVSAALTLLEETGTPATFLEGQQHLLEGPDMERSLRAMMDLFNDPERVDALIHPRSDHTMILFGDEIPEKPVPGVCFLAHRYVAGGGLTGALAVAGPARMRFGEVIPRLEYFSTLLGRSMSGFAHST